MARRSRPRCRSLSPASPPYLAHGNVDWAVAFFITIGALVGAIVGTHLLHVIPKNVLVLIFVATILATATRLLLGSHDSPGIDITVGVAIILVLVGFVSGTLAGLLGIGGGVIMVPAMATLGMATVGRQGDLGRGHRADGDHGDVPQPQERQRRHPSGCDRRRVRRVHRGDRRHDLGQVERADGEHHVRVAAAVRGRQPVVDASPGSQAARRHSRTGTAGERLTSSSRPTGTATSSVRGGDRRDRETVCRGQRVADGPTPAWADLFDVLSPDLADFFVHALVVGELDHVAVGISEHADVADRVRHLRRRHAEAACRCRPSGDRIDTLAIGELDAQVVERSERVDRRRRERIPIRKELRDDENERELPAVRMAEPSAVAVVVLALIEELSSVNSWYEAIVAWMSDTLSATWVHLWVVGRRLCSGSLMGPPFGDLGIVATLGPQHERVAPRIEERSVEPVVRHGLTIAKVRWSDHMT